MILEFSTHQREDSRKSRRSKRRSEERAAKKAPATVTKIHGTIGQFLEETFPPRDGEAAKPKPAGNGHVCTEAEAAALDFSPICAFVMHNGHSGTDEFATAMQKWLQDINIVARFSMVLCGQSKSKVMELIRDMLSPGTDNPEITKAEEFYAVLENGREDAERLVRMIRAAQTRHLVAMSSVCAEMNSEEAVQS